MPARSVVPAGRSASIALVEVTMEHDPSKSVTALAILSSEEDRLSLHRLFGNSNWILHTVDTFEEAVEVIRRTPMPVVIAEDRLGRRTWRDLLYALDGVEKPPVIIVTSRMANESLWGEVLNFGGYDLLMEPFERNEVYRVISLAWLHWKHGRTQPDIRTHAVPAG
ncbi:MAG TPA: hypothetical protein VFQ79_18535 [Bryobacteraceae bacterium]|nr:hypothetical protein [Bryobacteraceae bacterium]